MHVMLIVLSAGTCRVHASIVASVCESLLGVSLVDTCYAEVALGWNMMVPLYLGSCGYRFAFGYHTDWLLCGIGS